MFFAALSRFFARLDRRIAESHCRGLGHAYDFSSTDIVGKGPDPFAPAVWCDRCKRYVPDPRAGRNVTNINESDDCCLSHSCPHHDGWIQDASGEWFDPLDPTDSRYRPDR